ncbi:3-deoxy-manno-octulosonate-8-phosphatase KdsC [Rheinheimera baltica]|uniref:3-deoxy-manno-octulosonate-8-phosphatase KdsC n=1 Tax=Rheinheimera baltica TaxID=67576 RepID=UPI00273EB8FA|nr:3-deoxy-manno-octulosonate-8-phosphatase KdsC [Rheinheimera baltica]MDP5150356.1 3-deoxy-manno-octulosonate-8-phosphatase KdsC [Rheinheimera baltica]MDP5188667.1 3-deoxy-manno-octulosonate-8-phosphatase KdsC [Rheinheimera baltica]
MSLFNELYHPVSDDICAKASAIRLLICDVDGVFSDGRIYLGNNGEELKAFHTRDGFGIKALRQAGIEVAIITGRKSAIVQQRMTSLTVPYIYQGQENKLGAFAELQQQLQLKPEHIAYIGDDLADWTVMQHCGLAVAVNDAHPYLIKHAHFVTSIAGGHGAVRELADLLLISQNKFGLFDGSSS